MRLRCPHCKKLSTVRTSEQMSDTVTWMYMQCGNLECGHTWRVDAEASVTISPSARPDPTVNIPLSPHIARMGLRDQLERAPTGDHNPESHRMPLFDLAMPDPQPTG